MKTKPLNFTLMTETFSFISEPMQKNHIIVY